MKVYVFTKNKRLLRDPWRSETIRGVLERIAATTDVAHVVVAVYLLNRSAAWSGEYLADALEVRPFEDEWDPRDTVTTTAVAEQCLDAFAVLAKSEQPEDTTASVPNAPTGAASVAEIQP